MVRGGRVPAVPTRTSLWARRKRSEPGPSVTQVDNLSNVNNPSAVTAAGGAEVPKETDAFARVIGAAFVEAQNLQLGNNQEKSIASGSAEEPHRCCQPGSARQTSFSMY